MSSRINYDFFGEFYTNLPCFRSSIKAESKFFWVTVKENGKGCGKEKKLYVNNLKPSVWGNWSKNFYGNHEYLVHSLMTTQRN